MLPEAQADLSKIIRDGQIAVTIDDGTFKAIGRFAWSHIAAVNGGSILSSSTEGGDSGTFTLRIPAANFDKAMVQLGAARHRRLVGEPGTGRHRAVRRPARPT